MNLSNYQWQKIISLLKKINITAKNINLYVEAMTHNSYNNEHKLGFTYQRLEFLGDTIIQKIVTVYLYYLKLNEQEMTETRKMIVSGKTFKKASNELGLIEHAFLGKGISIANDTNKIREDLFESLMGAIYIDQGEQKVYEILKKTILKYYDSDELKENFDYKTKVQELLQRNMSDVKKEWKIHYKHEEVENNKFKSTLYFGNIVYGVGYGKTHKESDMNAAKEAYEKYYSKE